MATLTHQYALLVSSVIFTCLPELFGTSCQVYPSEYAYRGDSVTRSETPSANCRGYPQGSQPNVNTEAYIHCNGAQLRLTDSNFGSEQYNGSDYYTWPPQLITRYLLFIFPTRVNLTTITLHYYSDSDRGLPRLIFLAVPDDFDIWDAPTGSYSRVDVAEVPPGGEPAGRRNISITLNFNTTKVLMFTLHSTFNFTVSEVEFFTCVAGTTITTTIPVTTFSALPTIGPPMTTTGHDAIHPLQTTDSVMDCNSQTPISWTLVAILTVLFIGSLTINIIMLWIYKKRQSKDNNVETAMCEMEGNPCYETSNLKKTADTAGLQEAHVYERVKQN